MNQVNEYTVFQIIYCVLVYEKQHRSDGLFRSASSAAQAFKPFNELKVEHDRRCLSRVINALYYAGFYGFCMGIVGLEADPNDIFNRSYPTEKLLLDRLDAINCTEVLNSLFRDYFDNATPPHEQYP